MKFRILFLLILMSVGNGLLAQYERGLLPITNYTTKDYEALPQNWFLSQSENGVVYVGNNVGLLEFKGANNDNEKWTTYRVRNGSNVRTTAIDENGHIYVGARDEFGYFAPDSSSRGKLVYYSLIPYLDSNLRETRDIWFCEVTDAGVYFLSTSSVYYWDHDAIHVTSFDTQIKELFQLDNRVFILSDSLGVSEMIDGKVNILEGGESILSLKNDKMILGAIKFAPLDNQSGILRSYRTPYALVKLSIQGNKVSLSPFYTKLNTFILNNGVNYITAVKDYFVISTRLNGAVVISKTGELKYVINKNTGLQDNRVFHAMLDDQNYLWLALNNGISRVKLFSAFTKFPSTVSGFEEKIERIVRFNDKIYIGGANGLFCMDQNIASTNDIDTSLNSISNYERSSFSQITFDELLLPGVSVWGLKVFPVEGKELLLFSTGTHILEMNEEGRIRMVYNTGPWCFHVDKTDPRRLYVGLYLNGLGSLYYQDGEWIVEGRIPDFNVDVINIDQDNEGNIWMGSPDGAYLLRSPVFENHKLSNPQVTHYSKEKGLPKNDAVFNRLYNGEMIFGTGEGMYIYHSNKDTFLRMPALGEWFDKSHLIFRMEAGKDKELWSVVFSEDEKYMYLARSVPQSDGSYKTRRVLVDEGAQVHAIYPETKDIVWAAGSNGVFRIDYSRASEEEVPFRTFIKYVVSNSDTLFNGLFYNEEEQVIATQTDNLKPIVNYDNNNFEFVISSIGFSSELPLKYSFYLEGDDEEWTQWSPQNSRRYSNLHEGDYILHVKALDIFGNISATAEYAFTVKPPWYRTILAFVLYVLLFAGFVWGAVTISTTSLRKIIREATAEIRAQKDELEEKNNNILDSIRYAQRIQEAVLPSDAKLKRHFPEHFVLFKPRDIVSGDFYWMMNKGNQNIIVAADCTGHGVPGAFMSIMGVSFLNEIANNKDVNTAAEALNQLRYNVINSLNQDEEVEKSKDGMDLAMCVYNFEEMNMQFAGAYNHLYRVRNGEFETIKADRMPIGVHSRDGKPFTNQEIEIQKDDVYYILSDGYIDQFGGPDGKKYMTKRFKKLIMEICSKPMDEQKRILEEENLNWRGDIEQLDDIIVIGIKVV